MLDIIIQLISGAVGGNLAGAAKKDWSLGTIWNSVLGIIGGPLGAYLLGLLGINIGSVDGNLDVGSIVGSIAGGGVGGGALLAIVSLIKKAVKK